MEHQPSVGDLRKTDPSVPLRRDFSPEEVEETYSHAAWVYDLWARLTESRATKRALELSNIRDGEIVLEVAVGTGVVFKEIVERNKHGKNEGIDISPAMLSAAVRRMRGYDINCYHFEVGNAYKLPYKANEFDLVINNYMLDLLPESDFVNVLSEFFRVLKPSGRVVVVTMTFGRKWYNGFWHSIAKHFPSLLTNCRPVLIEKYMLVAGFKNLKMESLSQNTFPSQVVTASRP